MVDDHEIDGMPNAVPTHHQRREWTRADGRTYPSVRKAIKENNLSHAERLELIAGVERLMWKEAHKFNRRNPWMPVDDAYQEIWLKVYRAATCYDPTRGAKFTTHACNWIMSARTTMLSKHARTEWHSIDAPNDRGGTMRDNLQAPEHEESEAWTSEEWDETLEPLRPPERKCVELHLIHDMTFQQIGEILGVQKETARQYWLCAMRRLKYVEKTYGLFEECA